MIAFILVPVFTGISLIGYLVQYDWGRLNVLYKQNKEKRKKLLEKLQSRDKKGF